MPETELKIAAKEGVADDTRWLLRKDGEKFWAEGLSTAIKNRAGAVIGNLTHYAIIKYLSDHFPESIYNLPPDPEHVSKKRDGG